MLYPLEGRILIVVVSFVSYQFLDMNTVIVLIGIWLEQPAFLRIIVGRECQKTTHYFRIVHNDAFGHFEHGIRLVEVVLHIPEMLIQCVFHRVEHSLDDDGLHSQFTLRPLAQFGFQHLVCVEELNGRYQLQEQSGCHNEDKSFVIAQKTADFLQI